jgi:hypothetical protein
MNHCETVLCLIYDTFSYYQSATCFCPTGLLSGSCSLLVRACFYIMNTVMFGGRLDQLIVSKHVGISFIIVLVGLYRLMLS